MSDIKLILTPYISNFNVNDMYEYSNDDDRCLISPIYKNDLINFETRRFKKTSISIKTVLNNWIYLWKNNTFYNTKYLF